MEISYTNIMSDNELYLQHIQIILMSKNFSSRYGHCDIKEWFCVSTWIRPKPKLCFLRFGNHIKTQNTFPNNEKQEYLPNIHP